MTQSLVVLEMTVSTEGQVKTVFSAVRVMTICSVATETTL
jgi:hypothetical protein